MCWTSSTYGSDENCIQNASSRADTTGNRCRRDDNVRKDRNVMTAIMCLRTSFCEYSNKTLGSMQIKKML